MPALRQSKRARKVRFNSPLATRGSVADDDLKLINGGDDDDASTIGTITPDEGDTVSLGSEASSPVPHERLELDSTDYAESHSEACRIADHDVAPPAYPPVHAQGLSVIDEELEEGEIEKPRIVVSGFSSKLRRTDAPVGIDTQEFIEFKESMVAEDHKDNDAAEDPTAMFTAAVTAKLNALANEHRSVVDRVQSNDAGPSRVTGNIYLQDVTGSRPCAPKDGVSVNDPSQQDPHLRAQYDKLPFLPNDREIVIWRTGEPVDPGWTWFSSWAKQNRNLNVPFALDSLTFAQSGKYINPSRIDLQQVSVRDIYDGANRHRLYASSELAICLSALYSVESSLIVGRTRGVPQKVLTGILHSQEWQRFQAFLCIAFGHMKMKGQYQRNAMTFSTRPRPDGIAFLFPPQVTATEGMFGPPGIAKRSSAPLTSAALDFADNVPVYDARGCIPFDFNTDLPHIASKLPPFHGEIPMGSFTVVAYTASDFKAKDMWNLSCSIQWAIVCSTPNGFSDGDTVDYRRCK